MLLIRLYQMWHQTGGRLSEDPAVIEATRERLADEILK